jgi:hypothetical protein
MVMSKKLFFSSKIYLVLLSVLCMCFLFVAHDTYAAVPQPPATFTATPGACGTKKITLNWSAVPGATGYEVQRSVPGGVGGVWISVGNLLTHTHSNLPEGSTYTYKVRAKNATGRSTEKVSSPVTVTAPARCETPTTSLQPPATFYAVPGLCGTNKIYFSWSAVSGATGYDGQIDGGAWFDLGNVRTTIHNNVEPGSQHTYNIRARNANGFGPSKASSPVTVTAPPRCETPTTGIQPPTTFTATPGACGTKKITLNWSAVPGATGYEVQRSIPGGVGGVWINVGNLLTHTHSNLPEGSTYTYKVRAKNATGRSTEKVSSPVTVTAPVRCGSANVSGTARITSTSNTGDRDTTPNMNTAVGLPFTISGTATTQELYIVYETEDENVRTTVPVTDGRWTLTFPEGWSEAGQYEVRATRSNNSLTPYLFTKFVRVSPSSVTVTSNVDPLTSRANEEITISGTARSVYSLSVNVKSPSGQVTTKRVPVRYTRAIQNGTWSVTFPGFSETGRHDITFTLNSLRGVVLATKGLVITGGTTGGGTTPTTGIQPPTTFTATPGACGTKKITLNWSAVPGATGYEVQRSIPGGVGGVWINVGNLLTHTHSNLPEGSTYTYKVRAKNATGRSTEKVSSPVTVTAPVRCETPTTSLQPPATFYAVPGLCGTNKIYFSWSAVPGATGYDGQIDGGAWFDLGNVRTTIHNNVEPGSQHTYNIRARNANGFGPSKASSPVTVTAPPRCETPTTGIQPPTTFTATPGACGTKKITLNWSAVPGATGYEVQRSIPGGVGGVWINVGNLLTHTHSNLPEGSTYTYKVRAKNATGASTEKVSSPVTVTAPSTCSGLRCINDANGANGDLYSSGGALVQTCPKAPNGGISCSNGTCAGTGYTWINNQQVKWQGNTSGSCYASSACEAGYRCSGNGFCVPR